MAVSDVLAQLQQLLRKSTPLVEGAEPVAATSLKLSPGQQVTATVLSQLPSGRYLVQVNGQHMDLNLPADTRPGARVELRFVGTEPRPTFLLAQNAPAGGKTQVDLSDTARFIGALLSRAGGGKSEAAALTRSAPVLVAPPTEARELASALKSVLTESGLFYESHQAEWVSGQRSLHSLLREPQGQLSEPRAHLAAHADRAVNTNPAGEAESSRAVADRRPPAQVATESPREAGGETREPVHPATVPLVQQQLNALDSRQVFWQGEIWPGQTLRWEIEEREPQAGSPPAEREWHTRLALRLPLLGEVEAWLRLTPGGVQVDLSTAGEETRQRLLQGADDLRLAFARAELTLAQFTVKSDG